MTGDAYETADEQYCYPGTQVLKNLRDLRDADALQAFEVEAVGSRALQSPPAGNFSASHYRAVHRHLFQDVYDWAGKDRKIRIGKGGSLFCYPENIKREMRQLFARLKHQSFLPGAPREQFIAALAEFLADLNAIHPFREGNGRTQMVFVRMLSLRAGHPLRTEALRTEGLEADAFLKAMVASFHGDLTPLIDELERMQG